MRKYSKYLIFCFLGLSYGCIEALNIEGDENENLLVVEGFFSSENTTHSISITRTARFGSIFSEGGIIEPVTNASVIIRDDVGKSVLLVESAEGVYETTGGFVAEVGRSYSLLIELENGSRYTSLPELVRPAVPIDSISYSFEQLPISETTTRNGFEVSVFFEDGIDDNYYLWDHQGLYELTANPEQHTLPPEPPGIEPIPDPKSCCRTCYRTEEFDDLAISTDNLFDGIASIRSTVFVEDDGLRFVNEKYLIRVKQYAISSFAYEFYSLLQSQLEISGDIFDSPPATVRGNIVSLDNPDEEVIGYFWVADVAIDSVFIPSSARSIQARQVIIKDDCREISGTTIERPSFW